MVPATFPLPADAPAAAALSEGSTDTDPLMSTEPENRAPLALWPLFVKAFREAHRRRPLSFYLLLTIPLMLVLGAHIFNQPVSRLYFFGMFLLMLIFFWIIMVWAVRDIFAIYRQQRQEEARVYKETLGSTPLRTSQADKASSDPEA